MTPQKTAKKKKIWSWIGGLGVGLINGLLGAGGGMLAVPLLNASGLPTHKAHATSLAIIFPLSILSAGLYLFQGRMALVDALPYLPLGIVGALAGTWILPRIQAKWLRRIFGVFLLWAAWRLMFQ